MVLLRVRQLGEQIVVGGMLWLGLLLLLIVIVVVVVVVVV